VRVSGSPHAQTETKNQEAREMGDHWEDRRKGENAQWRAQNEGGGKQNGGRKTTRVNNGTPFNSRLSSPLAPSYLRHSDRQCSLVSTLPHSRSRSEEVEWRKGLVAPKSLKFRQRRERSWWARVDRTKTSSNGRTPPENLTFSLLLLPPRLFERTATDQLWNSLTSLYLPLLRDDLLLRSDEPLQCTSRQPACYRHASFSSSSAPLLVFALLPLLHSHLNTFARPVFFNFMASRTSFPAQVDLSCSISTSVPRFARMSAALLPSMSRCPGDHWKVMARLGERERRVLTRD
jgi:hypothetical protein